MVSSFMVCSLQSAIQQSKNLHKNITTTTQKTKKKKKRNTLHHNKRYLIDMNI
ncbi:hypothetical protein HanRHA438_Chr07g0301191 [Helianthus annuus]|nr:hypothetical protein HanRHA438_Chr07g0301191 [Helianthus annuus]